MDAQARAGIDLYGRVMRYAEVEQYNGRYRLLRLGSCDFEFDAAREVFEVSEPAHLETVAEAIGDVFSGTVATELRLAVHPPVGQVFFSPQPIGIGAQALYRRLEREAVLMSGQEPNTFRLAIDPAREQVLEAGDTVRWHQVTLLSREIQDHVERVLRVLPAPGRRSMTSMQGVARVLNRLARRTPLAPEDRPFTLAVGWYEGHVEFSLCEGEAWHFSHYTRVTAPPDALFFALSLLKRLHLAPEQVGAIFFYGVNLKVGLYDLFERAFGVPPEKLNAVPVVDLDPGSLSASFDVEAYAPCIGVSL